MVVEDVPDRIDVLRQRCVVVALLVVHGVGVLRVELARRRAREPLRVRQVVHVDVAGRPHGGEQHRREVLAERRDLDDLVALVDARRQENLGRLTVIVARPLLVGTIGRRDRAANVGRRSWRAPRTAASPQAGSERSPAARRRAAERARRAAVRAWQIPQCSKKKRA